MERERVTLGAIAATVGLLLLEEAVFGLLNSLLPKEAGDALLSQPVLLTTAVLLFLGSFALLWSVAWNTARVSAEQRKVNKNAWLETERFAALEQRHHEALQRIETQRANLEEQIAEAIQKLERLESERARTVADLMAGGLPEELLAKLKETVELRDTFLKADIEKWKEDAEQRLRSELGKGGQ